MNDALISGLLSSVVTAFLAPIMTFIIHDIHKYSKVTMFKKGDIFEGTWMFDDSDRIENDQIIIKSTRWGKIKCEGRGKFRGEYKSYKIMGKQYGYCITFEFFGLENERHDETAGIAIFKKNNPNINAISGRWTQLDINGNLIGGKMEWIRV